jgi:hypothetical protein
VSVEVKPGRWRLRNDEIAVVIGRTLVRAWPWLGYGLRDRQLRSWAADGRWGPIPGPWDLVEYLGPEEPQATS